jgi:hypothetical protein
MMQQKYKNKMKKNQSAILCHTDKDASLNEFQGWQLQLKRTILKELR